MAVKIRFTRVGKAKNPFYRISVVDGRKPRDTKFIDVIGHFNPLVTKEKRTHQNFHLDKIKALDWLKKGAQPSDVVRDLFTEENLWEEFTQTKKSRKPNKRKSRSTPVSEMLKRKEERKKIEDLKKSKLAKKEEKVKADPIESKTEENQVAEAPSAMSPEAASEEVKS